MAKENTNYYNTAQALHQEEMRSSCKQSVSACGLMSLLQNAGAYHTCYTAHI